MSWSAGRSDEVAIEIANGFELLRNEIETLARWPTAISIQHIEEVPSSDQRQRVRVIGDEAAVNEIFDTVIIATGFGLEPERRFGVQTSRYWEDDGLQKDYGPEPSGPRRILISGAGDGALIDLMCASLQGFRHETLLSLLNTLEVTGSIEERLLAVEKRLDSALLTGAEAPNLFAEYEEILKEFGRDGPPLGEVRRDTEVWFNFRTPSRYTKDSSILNRFFVAALCRAKHIKPKFADMTEGCVVAKGETYEVTFGPGDVATFDQVIIRHGVTDDYLGGQFPDLKVACAPLRGRIADLRLTQHLHDETRAFFA